MAYDKSELMQLGAEEKRALAFELLDSIDEEYIQKQIPEWQKKETLKRLAEMKANPDSAIGEKDFFNALEMDDEKL